MTRGDTVRASSSHRPTLRRAFASLASIPSAGITHPVATPDESGGQPVSSGLCAAAQTLTQELHWLEDETNL